ncbi:MAG TPA: metallopeptidase [Planctomycetia bacterium]|nr:metallopeptidase [Planctomycetia bacterium]
MLATLPLLWLLLAQERGTPAPKPDPNPAAHETRDVEGWTVRIDRRLLAGEEAALGAKAVAILRGQLLLVGMMLPADRLAKLRGVPIQLDLSCGDLKSAQYHPSLGWLRERGYAAKLAKTVHVPDAREFVRPRLQRHQPWMVMHELAHAYHDQVLGFGHAGVKAEWKKFAANGKHKETLHVDGKKREHYALTNEKEFFAEMTEAYVGRNDFHPFNAAELARDEPEIFRLMKEIWGPLP